MDTENGDKPQKVKRSRDAEATKKKILTAARAEFAKRGFDGARVDRIATLAKVNKQMLYHYFGNKDRLFTIVLEEAYRDIREREARLDLDSLPADQAILELVAFSWRHYLANPHFIRLLNSENQLEAKHLKKSPETAAINKSHVALMHQLLERGKREGVVRDDIDPVQLNISIAALGFFYLLNRHTLSTVYQRDLTTDQALDERLIVMKDTIARWIAPSGKP